MDKVLCCLSIYFAINLCEVDKCTQSDDTSCTTDDMSHHNEFIKQEFGRQSNSFYEASKIHKKDNLTPFMSY